MLLIENPTLKTPTLKHLTSSPVSSPSSFLLLPSFHLLSSLTIFPSLVLFPLLPLNAGYLKPGLWPSFAILQFSPPVCPDVYQPLWKSKSNFSPELHNPRLFMCFPASATLATPFSHHTCSSFQLPHASILPDPQDTAYMMQPFLHLSWSHRKGTSLCAKV